MIKEIELGKTYSSSDDYSKRTVIAIHEDIVFYKWESCVSEGHNCRDIDNFKKDCVEIPELPKEIKTLLFDLLAAIENGIEDQTINYAEKVMYDNEELIKEIRK